MRNCRTPPATATRAPWLSWSSATGPASSAWSGCAWTAGSRAASIPPTWSLILRHFEELSNAETAQVLGIKPSAAVNRYVRALRRLKDVFQGMPGGIEGIWG